MTLTNAQTNLLAAFSAHFGWAVAVIFGGMAFGVPWWAGAIAILSIAFVKETSIDPWLEGAPFWNGTFTSGAGDMVGYLIGVGATILVLAATAKLAL